MTPETARTPKQKHLEIEIKLKIRNIAKTRKALVEMGCEQTAARGLERNWTWDFPGQVLRRRGELLRVRQFAGRCVLTFKGVAQQSQRFKIREERETEVQDLTTLGVILERLGLQVISCYEKFRTTYSYTIPGPGRSVQLAVDETPIGKYLEIEGIGADIEKVAAKLGFGKEAFINESYLTLFAKSRLRTTQRHMVFPTEMHAKSRRV